MGEVKTKMMKLALGIALAAAMLWLSLLVNAYAVGTAYSTYICRPILLLDSGE
jgi:hypothetical protein